MCTSGNVQTVRKAERTIAKNPHGYNSIGSVVEKLLAASAHTGHILEKRRQVKVNAAPVRTFMLFSFLDYMHIFSFV